MNQVGKIRIRPESDLLRVEGDEMIQAEGEEIIESPEKHQKVSKRKKAATTLKKNRTHNVIATAITEVKKSRPRRKVDPLPGQLRIDSYYNSANKTFTIEGFTCTKVLKKEAIPKKPIRRRKALFQTDDESSTTVSDEKNLVFGKGKTKRKPECIIDLCSESEAEAQVISERKREGCESASKKVRTKARRKSAIISDTSLHRIEEAVSLPENVETTPLRQDVTKSAIEPSLSPQAEVCITPESPKMTTKPNKSTQKPKTSNCNEWLEKKNKESIETRCTAAAATSNSIDKSDNSNSLGAGSNVEPNVRKLRISAENFGKNSCKRKELAIGGGTTNSNSSRTKRGDKGRTSITATESIQTKPTTKRANKNIRKKNILSPSDTTSSRTERRANKRSSPPSTDTSSSKKHKSTKLPTSPESMERFSSISDTKPACRSLKLESLNTVQGSFPADTIVLSDEEQENVRMQKLPCNRKRNQRVMKPQKTVIKKPPRPCPPYKVVEGTSFAVDAFRYGDIKGVTHYFLTHFHADHYIGLNRKFAHEVYMSPITARLLRIFIPIDEKYIKELALNVSIEIGDVEVTAIDANHCPGAIMLIFKTRAGRCILHTGDFRASAEMESEPIFWNNDIHTIYLDTTYFPKKYAFCAQSDSIDQGLYVLKEFHEKNVGTRILYVCGSYLIGKEKFWSTIAHNLSLKVWTDVGRRKALNAIRDENLLSLLVDDPHTADLHVIPMVHLSYFSLVDYIDKYSAHFDILFALRPSGWEKNSKPNLRGRVNIVGIEYSEHSSHDELKRFVQYLKPQKVISTVPVSHNPMNTAKIPESWYKYKTLTGLQHQFQPSITSYFKLNNQAVKTPPVPQKPVAKSLESAHVSQMVVSPLDRCTNAVSIVETETGKPEEKVDEKHHIFSAEEEDDWLT